MRIVRHGHAAADSLPFRMVKHRVLRGKATSAIARAIPITTARTTRLRARSATRRRITTIEAIRSRVLTIRLPRATTQRRGPIPRQAAAIQLHRALTPHPAVAIAAVAEEGIAVMVEVAAVVAVAGEARTAVAEVHTAVEGPALTADTNLFVSRTKGPPAKSGAGLFFFVTSHALPLVRRVTRAQLFQPSGV